MQTLQMSNPMLRDAMKSGLFSVLLLLASNAFADGAKSRCAIDLPKNLKEQLSAQYERWRVVQKSDLLADDLRIWNGSFPKSCPGVIRADFDGSGVQQYAVLLNSRAEEKSLLLVAKEMKKGSFVLSKLLEMSRVNSPVIHIGKPGRYFDVSDRSKPINIRRPTIVLEVLESSAQAFFYDGTKIQSAVLSE